MHFLFIEFYSFILLSKCKEHYTYFPYIAFGGRLTVTASTVGHEYLSNFRRNSYFFLSLTRWEITWLFVLSTAWLEQVFFAVLKFLLLWQSIEMNSMLECSIFWLAPTEAGNSLLQADRCWWCSHSRQVC